MVLAPVETRRLPVDLEWRAGDLKGPGTLSGVVLRYGDTADLPWGRERFERGALAAGDVLLNVQHDRGRPLARYPGGGLELELGADAVSMRATLPDTSDARDLAALVRAGVMRGLSVEFRPVDERIEAGVRVVSRAALTGIAVVDEPAYPDSQIAAMRAAMRPAPRRWRSWR